LGIHVIAGVRQCSTIIAIPLICEAAETCKIERIVVETPCRRFMGSTRFCSADLPVPSHIVTTAYRYKPPPRERKAVAIAGRGPRGGPIRYSNDLNPA
jgi:hypothetical protein